MTSVTLLNGVTSWTVPSDWSATNTIETWGGGAGGSSDNFTSTVSSGGGGGAYISISNIATLTIGNMINVTIGTGGAGETASAAAKVGGDTWFNGTTLAGSSVGAKGGSIATGSAAGGAGGLGTSCIPASGFLARATGGTGGKGQASGSGGGGGGGAGSSGAGGSGGVGLTGTGNGGAGGAGDAGSGGAGGAGGTVGVGGAGTANALGGGGGGGAKGTAGASTGGAGGLPGGAGGGGSTDGSASIGGAGANSQIIITYTPGTTSATVISIPWDMQVGKASARLPDSFFDYLPQPAAAIVNNFIPALPWDSGLPMARREGTPEFQINYKLQPSKTPGLVWEVMHGAAKRQGVPDFEPDKKPGFTPLFSMMPWEVPLAERNNRLPDFLQNRQISTAAAIAHVLLAMAWDTPYSSRNNKLLEFFSAFLPRPVAPPPVNPGNFVPSYIPTPIGRQSPPVLQQFRKAQSSLGQVIAPAPELQQIRDVAVELKALRTEDFTLQKTRKIPPTLT